MPNDQKVQLVVEKELTKMARQETIALIVLIQEHLIITLFDSQNLPPLEVTGILLQMVPSFVLSIMSALVQVRIKKRIKNIL